MATNKEDDIDVDDQKSVVSSKKSNNKQIVINPKIKRMSTKQIQQTLLKAGLSTIGDRYELMCVLNAYMKLKSADNNEDDIQSNVSECESDAESEHSYYSKTSHHSNQVRSNFSFQDVESSFKKFSGDDLSSVNRWVQDFEEQSAILNWDKLQMLVYAKRCLTGTALLATQTEAPKSWNSLRKLLINEFTRKYSGAEIHKRLAATVKTSEESFLSFCLRMREIASSAKVDDLSVIQYIINGIHDKNENKAILYGASNFNEFKAKLKIYENYKQNSARSSSYATASSSSSAATSSRQQQSTFSQYNKNTNYHQQHNQKKEFPKCTYCTRYGHYESECRVKNMICSRCNQVGHKARFCQATTVPALPLPTLSSQTLTAPSVIPLPLNIPAFNQHRNINLCSHNLESENGTKYISINNNKMFALIDSGSEYNLLREDIYKSFRNAPTLSKIPIHLYGVGNGNFMTTGFAIFNIQIENNDYQIVMHIVPQKEISVKAVLGREFLRTVKVIIDENGIKIEKPKTVSNGNNNLTEIKNISDSTNINCTEYTNNINNEGNKSIDINSYKVNDTSTEINSNNKSRNINISNIQNENNSSDNNSD